MTRRTATLPGWAIWSALILLRATSAETSSPNTGDQLQAFRFQYTSTVPQLPIQYTCPSPFTLTQSTPTNNGGPDPVAPYTMISFVHEQLMDGSGVGYERIYARSLVVGDMSKSVSFSHPWANGTQHISCIWASNGVSGGCQDLITVVPSPDLTLDAYENSTSQCRIPSVMGSWVTNTSQTLDVDVTGPSGTVSVNAWPQSCSDLTFTPQNGTAPYTLVIAPAFHPPVNITSSGSKNSMTYRVRLSHGQAFMAGVFDSAGNSFAIGPLHAGFTGDPSCLNTLTGQKVSSKGNFGSGILAGGTIGGFIVGALGAQLLAWLWTRRKYKSGRKGFDSNELLDPYADPRPASYRADSNTSSTYGKPLPPVGYSDLTPPVGYDNSPATLYDPAPGSGSPYTARGGPENDVRPFPRPDSQGAYSTPYDNHRRSRSSLHSDFNPPWTGGTDGMYGSSSTGHYDSTTAGSSTPRNSVGVAGPRGPRAVGSGGKASRMHAMGGASPSIRSRSFHEDEENEEEVEAQGRRARNVYVVHSDGGGGDVHIRLPVGEANVIELPPTYQTESGTVTSPPLIQPTSPPPASMHSARSRRSPSIGAGGLPLPTFELQQSRSRGSMTEDEIRARAEAALAEKGRPPSGSPHPPRH